MSPLAAAVDDGHPRTRVSGRTAGQEVAEERAAELDPDQVLDDAVLPDERARGDLEGLNFSRLRLDWRDEDARDLDRAEAMVEQIIGDEFAEAFSVIFEVWSIVRDPEPDPVHPDRQAEDERGEPAWRRTESGEIFEDWSRLGYAQREALLFRLTTNCFVWEQRAETYRFRAMWAKLRYRLEFAKGYDQAFEGRPLADKERDTIERRTARAEVASDEDYVFALLKTYVSRRADAVVRGARAVEQRLKDVTVAR